MKKLYAVVLFGFACTIANAQWQWAKSAGGSSDDEGSSICIDGNGNEFVTGYFLSPSIIFGSDTFTNAGGKDIFLAKYDALGNVLWARCVGGSNDDECFKVSTDNNGNVLLTGSFLSPSITFGSITLINASTGNADIFVVKYDAAGNVLWAKSAGGISDDEGMSIATDGNGNSYLTGYFGSPTITFGSYTLTEPGSGNLFLVKYSSSGNVLWAKSVGGNALGYGVCTDGLGNLFVTGSFYGPTTTFGTTTLTSAGSGTAFFIVKYDASGNVLWAQCAGGQANDEGYSVSADGNGNVFVTGEFQSSTITFGSYTFTNVGGQDVFLTKYDASGNVLWAKCAGGSGTKESRSVNWVSNGNVFLTGHFEDTTIIFGSTTLINSNPPFSDIFIVKYDAVGNVLWAQNTGEIVAGYGGCTDVFGNLFVTGYFQSSTITFGSNTLTNAGIADIFIAKLASNTGINEVKLDNAILIYPNPTSGVFHLKISQFENIKMNSVEIYNVYGEKVYSTIINSQSSIINFDAPGGIYFLQFKTSEGIVVKKIVKE